MHDPIYCPDILLMKVLQPEVLDGDSGTTSQWWNRAGFHGDLTFGSLRNSESYTRLLPHKQFVPL